MLSRQMRFYRFSRLYGGRILILTAVLCFLSILLTVLEDDPNVVVIVEPPPSHVVEGGVESDIDELDDVVPHNSSEATTCYFVQAHTCSQTGWTLSETRGIHVSEENPLMVRKVQGLWNSKCISLAVCEYDKNGKQIKTLKQKFVTHDGCDIRVEEEADDIYFKQKASFIQHKGRYINGFYALESADFHGHFITAKGGRLTLEAEDSSPTYRIEASWMFDTDKDLEMAQNKKRESLRSGVYLLKQPVPYGTVVPNVIDDETTCAREHHGCCDIQESGFVTPQTTNFGNADPATTDVTAIILSSKNTLGKRRALLNRWLLGPIQRGTMAPWARAVISLDCFTDDIDINLVKTDWVVGPLGSGPVGLPMITVRVPLVTHWTFEKYPDASWYFTIDDDTLVFSENVVWALSWLPNPHERLWYVGHSTEWKIKIWFHGRMAFGGGGILISNKGRRDWIDYWQGGLMNASRSWLLSGKCSHDGGDGTVCRCLKLASGETNMFTDFRGFHQYDIVGTASMLDIIKDTCPNCPTTYEQAGLWLDDIVSQHTLCTFHHLLAIADGSVFPGTNGSTTGLLFYDAYGAYPYHLLMKRVCGRSQNNTHTLCINFGHQLQIFKNTLEPDDAFVLLDARDGTDKERPTENLIYLAVKSHIQLAQLCSMHYQFGGTPERTIYIGNFVTPRAEHDPPCEGQADVKIEGNTLHVVVNMKEVPTIVWRQQLPNK
eukprot:TRINITY_DN4104_c0_g1_i2.p1 TRINITY_DN4104_c0_g1~~TRINITY_DN4104_c0_g1_i2.p1  ORF type:complete len:734 (+),score=150.60 TRINITY_DN4104_c0_g1_i2:52-2202(+)